MSYPEQQLQQQLPNRGFPAQEALARRRRRHSRSVSKRSKKSPIGPWSMLSIFLVFLTLFVASVPPTSDASAQPSSSPDNSENTTTSIGGPIIGIDLGTTYSCVGVYRNGKVEILANDQGNRITPSYVAFDPQHGDGNGGRRLTGDAAKNQATLHPEHTVFDVKRLMGRDFDDPTVQRDRQVLPYSITRSANGKPQIYIPGQEEPLTPEQISAMVLRQMKDIASEYLGQEVQRAVITVPAYFNKAQREATRDAGIIAGLHVERIINEPTAAAIAYGLNNEDLPEDATVLVYDLGGGTFDVTLLTMDDGFFEVIATAGDTHLGGEDFDERIMKYYEQKLLKTQGIDLGTSGSTARPKLRKEVERVKRALSSQLQARLEVDDLDLSETLTRARFEELNHDLFQKTLEPIRQVLKDAKLKPSDVDRIVLVGGSTRIPKVQQLVSEFFGGKEISKGVHPDEAVAHGAAILGGILSGEEMDGSPILLDVTSLSQGIETVGGVMTTIIPRGTTLPVKKSQTFSTQQDNQSAVTIQIFEGERSMSKDNHLLGSFTLTGIPPAPRGVPQIEVTFTVDVNGLLQVGAEEKGTGKAQNITITTEDQRLSKEEVERMVEEANRYAEEDRLWKERVEARQGLESYLYNLRNTADDNESGLMDNLSSADRKEFMDLIDEGLDWLESNTNSAETEEFNAKRKELESIVNPIMRQAYGGGGGSTPDDEDFGDDEL